MEQTLSKKTVVKADKAEAIRNVITTRKRAEQFIERRKHIKDHSREKVIAELRRCGVDIFSLS